MTTARPRPSLVGEDEGATPAGARSPDLLTHPLLLTAAQAARTLGMSRASVYRLIARRRLRGVHIGAMLRIPRQELEAFVAALTAAAREEADDDPAD